MVVSLTHNDCLAASLSQFEHSPVLGMGAPGHCRGVPLSGREVSQV